MAERTSPVGGNPRHTGEPPRHGTTHAYINYGCRCAPCKDAWKVYAKQRWTSIRQLQEQVHDLQTQLGTAMVPMDGTPVLLRRNWDGSIQIGELDTDHSWVFEFTTWKDA